MGLVPQMPRKIGCGIVSFFLIRPNLSGELLMHRHALYAVCAGWFALAFELTTSAAGCHYFLIFYA
jgi:hypothetical protein